MTEKPGYEGQSEAVHVFPENEGLVQQTPVGPDHIKPHYRGVSQAMWADPLAPSLNEQDLWGGVLPFAPPHIHGRSDAIHVRGPRDDPSPETQPKPIPTCQCDCGDPSGSGGVTDQFATNYPTDWGPGWAVNYTSPGYAKVEGGKGVLSSAGVPAGGVSHSTFAVKSGFTLGGLEAQVEFIPSVGNATPLETAEQAVLASIGGSGPGTLFVEAHAVVFNTGGGGNVSRLELVIQPGTTFQHFDLPFNFQAGNTYHIQVEAQGGQFVGGRIWLDGTTPPAMSFMSSPAPTVPSSPQFTSFALAVVASGSATVASETVTTQFDNLDITGVPGVSDPGAPCLGGTPTAPGGTTGGGVPPPDGTLGFVTPNNDPMPAYLGTIVDSTWKTTARRITNSNGERHTYAKVQAWNSDGSKIFVRPGAILDGSTYAHTSHSIPAEARWSNLDPDVMFGVVSGGAGLVRHHVSTGVTTTLRTFPGFGQLRMGTNEGNISDDDRFVVLNEGTHFVVYDIINNTYTEHNLGSAALDNISISHSGNYIVAVWVNNGTGRYQGMELFTRAGVFIRQLTSVGGSHGDFAYDTIGHEVWVVCHAPDARMYRLDTASSTQLLSNPNAYARGHVCGRLIDRPGWVGFSDYGGASVQGQPGYGQLALVKCDGSGTVEIFGFTHHYDDAGGNYTAQPQAVWNRDGTKVIWASNWDVSGGPVYDFEAEGAGAPLGFAPTGTDVIRSTAGTCPVDPFDRTVGGDPGSLGTGPLGAWEVEFLSTGSNKATIGVDGSQAFMQMLSQPAGVNGGTADLVIPTPTADQSAPKWIASVRLQWPNPIATKTSVEVDFIDWPDFNYDAFAVARWDSSLSSNKTRLHTGWFSPSWSEDIFINLPTDAVAGAWGTVELSWDRVTGQVAGRYWADGDTPPAFTVVPQTSGQPTFATSTELPTASAELLVFSSDSSGSSTVHIDDYQIRDADPCGGGGGGGTVGPCGIGDSFDRVVAPNAWGTSDAGIAWTINDGLHHAAVFEVANGAGVMIDEAAFNTVIAGYGGAQEFPMPLDIQLDVSMTNIPSSGGMLRINVGGDQSALALDLHPESGLAAIQNGDFSTGIEEITTPLNVPLRIRLAKVLSGTATVLSAKIWPVGMPEPANWMISDQSARNTDTISILALELSQQSVNSNFTLAVDNLQCGGMTTGGCNPVIDDFNRNVNDPTAFANRGTWGGDWQTAAIFQSEGKPYVNGSEGVISMDPTGSPEPMYASYAPVLAITNTVNFDMTLRGWLTRPLNPDSGSAGNGLPAGDFLVIGVGTRAGTTPVDSVDFWISDRQIDALTDGGPHVIATNPVPMHTPWLMRMVSAGAGGNLDVYLWTDGFTQPTTPLITVPFPANGEFDQLDFALTTTLSEGGLIEFHLDQITLDSLCPPGGGNGNGNCSKCQDPDPVTGTTPPLPIKPGYLPIFRKQIGDPTTSLDHVLCTMESAAMALDFHTRGAIQVWGGELVKWCGRSEADIALHGTNLGNVRTAWAHYNQVFDNRSGETFSSLLRCLHEGRACVIQGDYGALTIRNRCQASFEGNHAVVILPYSSGDMWTVGDPLCNGFVARSESALQTYVEAFGRAVFGSQSPQPILFGVSRAWTT